ncbi:hypothetical protein C0Q70_06710 [Pomacea canaliculata]|uniref:Uncharacterized protein n=1 Tax=Pomacea canaliculata TaxID=400727 RepID=A0A2T7PD10_POMCA|nr:hypothetical protein C0Q70_06710 [Pomacea canaliculata]
MRQLMILAAALLILCVEMSSCDAEPDAIEEEVLHKPHKRASDQTTTRLLVERHADNNEMTCMNGQDVSV